MASTATKVVIVGAAGVGAYLLYKTYSAKNQSPYPSGLAPWADQTALGYPAPYTEVGGSNPTPAGAPPTVSIPMSSIDPSGNTALKIYAMVPPGVPVGFSAQQIYSNPQAAINGKVEIAPGITVSPLDIWSNTDVSEGIPIEGAVRSGDWCSCASIPLLDPTPAMLPGGVVAGQITDYLGRPMNTATVAQTLANGGFCTTPGETMEDAQNDVRFMAWYNALSKVPGGMTLFKQAMSANQQSQSQAQTVSNYQNAQGMTAQTQSTGSSPLSRMLKVVGINLNSYGVQDTSIDGAVDASGGNIKAAIASALAGSDDPYIRDHADAFATAYARNLTNANLSNPNVAVSFVNPGGKTGDVTLHATDSSSKLANVLNEMTSADKAKNAVIFPGANASNSAMTLVQRPNGSNVVLVNNGQTVGTSVPTSGNLFNINQLPIVAQQNPATDALSNAQANLNVALVLANAYQNLALPSGVTQPIAQKIVQTSQAVQGNLFDIANLPVVPRPAPNPSSGPVYVSPGVAQTGSIGWW